MTPKQARRAARKDHSRRRRWLTAVNASGVTPGCKAWGLDLADHSDDAAKPVWGLQTGQAARIGRCERSVRTYRLELEEAGLIRTIRAEPQRDRATGEFFRRHSNTYVFIQPTRAELEAHRAQRRSTTSASETASSDLPAADCRSTPFRVKNPPRTAGGSPPPPRSEPWKRPSAASAPSPLRPFDPPEDPRPPVDPAVVAAATAEARAALRRGHTPVLREAASGGAEEKRAVQRARVGHTRALQDRAFKERLAQLRDRFSDTAEASTDG